MTLWGELGLGQVHNTQSLYMTIIRMSIEQPQATQYRGHRICVCTTQLTRGIDNQDPSSMVHE